MKRSDEGPGEQGRRSGFALLVAILVLLATTALAHGLLVVARHEHASARIGADLLTARVAAQSEVLASLDDPSAIPPSSTRVGDDVVVPEPVRPGAPSLPEVKLTRLGAEVWLVSGTAGAGRVVQRRARPVWILDPWTRAAAFDAVVVVGAGAPSVLDGPIAADEDESLAVLPSDGCPVRPDGVAPGEIAGSDPTPSSLLDPGGMPTLGRFSLDSLAVRLDGRVDGRGTPTPVERYGSCGTDDPWNWGDPERSGRPCSAYRALIVAEGPLFVDGGVGQGLLVVRGDVALDGARFYGMILASGTVTMSGTSVVTGRIGAGAGVTVAPNAAVRGSRCWAASALTGDRLRAPSPLARSWIRIVP